MVGTRSSCGRRAELIQRLRFDPLHFGAEGERIEARFAAALSAASCRDWERRPYPPDPARCDRARGLFPRPRQIVRANVRTPVTNAPLVCPISLYTQNIKY